MKAAKTFNPEDQTFSPPAFYLDQVFGAGKWEMVDEDVEIEMDSAEEAEDDEDGALSRVEDEEEDERENRANLKRTHNEI